MELIFFFKERQAFLWSGLVKGLNIVADQPPRCALSRLVFEDSKMQAEMHELELSRPTQ